MTLNQLERRRGMVRAYCEYVGTLITAEGVAAALGVSKKWASVALSYLRQRGLLRIYRTAHVWKSCGRKTPIWEWVR